MDVCDTVREAIAGGELQVGEGFVKCNHVRGLQERGGSISATIAHLFHCYSPKWPGFRPGGQRRGPRARLGGVVYDVL